MARNFLEGEFNIPKMEEEVLTFWDDQKIFEKSLEKTAQGKPFTFYDGPPFATGLPHYGHILASTIKDVVPRYQTMNGHFVRRRWGWDCHGLPIEEIVERKLGISGKKQIEQVGIKKFNETCRSMVLQYVSEWRAMVRRIARWVDFDDSYKTMDADFMESVWWGFKQMYQKKLIYEGRKVLLYCPRCETPVSNFEVAMDNSYKDVSEEAVTIAFKVIIEGQTKGLNLLPESYFLAWTTTPWTLPGNVALAINPALEYGAYVVGGKAYIVVKDRAEAYGFSNPRVTWPGSQLRGVMYEPLYAIPEVASSPKAFHVYAADFVTTTEGTGIVHTAVVYGEEDYALGVREGLPVVPLLDEKGTFNEKAPELVRGKYFKAGEKIIKNDLESRGLLFKKELHTHSYPHCWRCGTTLFYNALPAWFVNIQEIKAKLLKSNDKEINWFPDHLKHGRYEKSVEAAPDWNISRNRYWGNPIPVWRCAKCGKEEVVGGIEELGKRAGPPQNKYWVMRHGEADNNVLGVPDSGTHDFHLTPKGVKQIEASIKKLKNIDLIFSSDVLRAKETSAIAAKVFGHRVIFDERIHEVRWGEDIEGISDEAYQAMFPSYESRFEKKRDGTESFREVRARVWNFLKECESKYEGKNILIVSHGDPIWMMLHSGAGLSERATIAKKRSDEHYYLKTGEVRELPLLVLPRNDSGEADLHMPYIDEITFPCASCAEGVMRRTPEIFDSWIEAGSMPFAEYHYPFENEKVFKSRFPAQFVAEYIAQTRAWFYLMHVVSFILFGKAPFENVVTTGTILAEDGTKMSKSKNNFPNPQTLIDKYGADSLRFYLMNSVVMQADNLNFSEKGVESVYRKVEMLLLNVYKYFSTYIGEENGEEAAGAGANVLDEWITLRTEELVAGVTEYLDGYDTVRATRAIQEYVDDLSTWYLRRSRKRRDKAFFATLQNSLLVASKVVAPFMPFLAEALYHGLVPRMPKGDVVESVHLAEWPAMEFSANEKERDAINRAMAEVRRLASLGLAKRAEAKIKVRQPLQAMRVKANNANVNGDFLELLKDEINVKEIIFDPALEGEVELDAAITPALKEEGTIRDIARMVQELRQEAKLLPRDKVVVMLALPPEMRDTVMKHETVFKRDVGAKEVDYKRSDKFQAEELGKLDGQEVWIGIRKV